LIGRLRLFVDFANVRPSLAVGPEPDVLLLTTPSVAEFVELSNDGGDIRDLGRTLGIERVVKNGKSGVQESTVPMITTLSSMMAPGIFSISESANKIMPPKSSRVMLTAGSSKGEHRCCL
jgi:hypothetical protein